MNSTDWKIRLLKELGLKDDNDEIALENYASILKNIFQDSLYPQVNLVSATSNVVYVPEKFYVKNDINPRLFILIKDPSLFYLLPDNLVICYLDILYLICRRSIYDIIRLQYRTYCWNSSNANNTSLLDHLISLLTHLGDTASNINISKRIVLLIGLVGAAGVLSLRDISKFMQLFRVPSDLSTSLLQSLHLMMRTDAAVLKAYPKFFFNFYGSPKSGIYINKFKCPFNREFQYFSWFRIESFDQLNNEYTTNSHQSQTQIILSILSQSNVTADRRGIEIYVENKQICILISLGNGKDPILIKLDQILARGVWYHLSLKHFKPSLIASFFGNDELIVHLDHKLVYSDKLTFPFVFNEPCAVSIGENFDGQMTPIYFLHETLPQSAVEFISRVDAGKTDAYNVGNSMNVTNSVTVNNQGDVINFVDLLPSITMTDKKIVLVASKIALVIHPDRCWNGNCFDVHGSFNGKYDVEYTFPWMIQSTLDSIISLGGMSMLLPILPRMFVDSNDLQDNCQQSSCNSLGTSLGDISDVQYTKSLLDPDSMSVIKTERQDFIVEGSLSLLFHILTRMLSYHKIYQQQLQSLHGFNMIEYAIRCIPPNVLLQEGETCALSLLMLRSSISNNNILDESFVTRILFNFQLWSRSSYKLQSSLMSVLLGLTKSQTPYFLKLIGVQGLVDSFAANYCQTDSDSIKSSSKTIGNSTSDSVNYPTTDSNESHTSVNKVISDSDTNNWNANEPVQLINETHTLRIQDFKPRKSFRLVLNKDITRNEIVEDLEQHGISSAINESRKLNIGRSTLPRIPESNELYVKTGMLRFHDTDSLVSSPDLVLASPFPDDVSIKSDYGINLSSSNLELQLKSLDSDSQLNGVLNTDQLKYLRDSISSMIVELALFGSSEREIQPIIQCISLSKNPEMLHELSQLLLCLIVEGGSQIMTTITTVCHTPEEFASFVIFNLIHQSLESTRSVGIRVLTHYYLRLDLLPPSIFNSALKRMKFNLLQNPSINSPSIRRLASCGGISLLSEIIASHSKDCTDLTYSTLLEMLMMRNGVRTLISIKYKDRSLNFASSNTFANTLTSNPTTPVVFAAQYLSQDQMQDDGSIINSEIIPVFFEALPKMPIKLYDQIFNDLLVLLKHSSGNRDTCCENSLWPMALFDMVKQVCRYNLIKLSEPADLLELSNAESHLVTTENFLDVLIPPMPTDNYAYITPVKSHNKDSDCQDPVSPTFSKVSHFKSDQSMILRNLDRDESISSLDLKFSIGMKVYSTLLVHSLEKRDGWKDLQSTLSLGLMVSLDSKNSSRKPATNLDISQSDEYSTAKTILSHLINELTFGMKSKFKELQRLAKSSSIDENEQATYKLENVLKVLVLSSQFMLINNNFSSVVPSYDIAKLRLTFYKHNFEKQFVASKILSNLSDILKNNDIEHYDNDDEKDNDEDYETIEDNITVSVDSWKETVSNNGQYTECGPNIMTSVEEMLVIYLNSSKDKSIESTPSESELESSFNSGFGINFSHKWIDLLNPLAATSPNNTADGQISPTSIRTNASFRDHCLHPLERGHDSLSGSLKLALQTLRLFDTVFWPKSNIAIRNYSMLSFKLAYESSAKNDQQEGKSVKFSQSQQNSPSQSQNHLTLYTCIIRVSLFALTNLSPYTDLASLNLLRIKAMIELLEKFSNSNTELSSSTPFNDIVVAVLIHVSITIQRLIQSLLPFFHKFGLNSFDLNIPLAGAAPESYSQRSNTSIEKDVESINISDIDSTFNNPMGRQLYVFCKNCMNVLLAICYTKRELVSKVIDRKTYDLFDDLTQKLRKHIGEVFIDSSSGLKVLRSDSTRLDISKVISGTDAFTSMSSIENDSALPSTNDDTLGEATDISPNVKFLNSLRTPMKSSDGSDIIRNIKNMFIWIGHPYFYCNYFASIEIIKTFEFLDSYESTCNSTFLHEINVMHDAISSKKSSLSSIFVEEIMELKESSINLTKQMKSAESSRMRTKTTLESLRLKQIASKWQELIYNFDAEWSPWINLDYYDQLNSKSTNEIGNINDSNTRIGALTRPQTDGKAYLELSRLKDQRLRRMILARLPEVIDHSDAAYLEGKIKDQEIFESQSNQNTPVKETSESLVNTPMDDPVSLIKPETFKMLLTNKTNNAVEDDFEDDDNDGDYPYPGMMTSNNTTTSNSLSNLVMNASFFSTGQLRQRPLWSYMFHWEPEERLQLITENVSQIQLEHVIEGVLLLTNKAIYFHPKIQTGGYSLINSTRHFDNSEKLGNVKTVSGSNSTSKLFNDQRWYLDRITEIYSRRYLLQNCGLELYFIDVLEIFFVFKSSAETKKFYRYLKRQSIPLLSLSLSFGGQFSHFSNNLAGNLTSNISENVANSSLMNTVTSIATLRPNYICQHSIWTDLWRKRHISNYEYLIRLNIIAGRSYNDITQYPVFPWILADYSSDVLDLSNPRSYRDLSKPVGALNPFRLNEFLERYKSFDDSDSVPKFLYGSHYSSAGVVLHYLIRQEPFTSMAINLQGGRFDCADRIFFDIKRTWQGCNNSMSDVKELIPELFTSPEILVNSNNFNLGCLQEGSRVNNVILPPWANNNPFEFIRLHREALESEYVSEHLNDWIDLIFGYKQRGKYSIEANNLFYYLTYEDAVNIDSIEDPLQKEATKAQIIHFGQTPSQLFNREHPKRLPLKECPIPLFSDSKQLHRVVAYLPSKQYALLSNSVAFPVGNDQSSKLINSHGAVISIQCAFDRLVVIHADLCVAYYRWNSFPDSDGIPFQLKPEKKKFLPSQNLSVSLEIMMRRYYNENQENFDLSSHENLVSSVNDKSELNSVKAALNSDESNKIADSEINSRSGSSFTKFARQFSFHKSSDLNQPSPSVKSKSFRSPKNKNKDVNSTVGKSASSFRFETTVMTAKSKCTVGNVVLNNLRHEHVGMLLDDSVYSGRVISIGYWDNSIKIHSLDNLKDIGNSSQGINIANTNIGNSSLTPLYQNQPGNSPMTCIQIAYQCGTTIITGNMDGTCRVWILENPTIAMSYADRSSSDYDLNTNDNIMTSDSQNGLTSTSQSSNFTNAGSNSSTFSSNLNSTSANIQNTGILQCVRSLFGHQTSVTAINYNGDLDVLLSASSSGLLCLHSVRQGNFLRSIYSLLGHEIDRVLVSSQGYLVVHSKSHLQLRLFWINCQSLAEKSLHCTVECMAVNEPGNILVTGLIDGTVLLRSLHNLEELYLIDTLRIHGSITALWFTDDMQFLLIGSENGVFSVATDPDNRWRILHATIQKTPLLGPNLKGI